jgi:hypothetical protein
VKVQDLKRKTIILFALIASTSASAASLTGSQALALASLVAAQSPVLSRQEKRVMARLFDGHSNLAFSAGRKISVKVDEIVCRASDVDITSRSCKLTFGETSTNVTGRAAHELYATISEVGVPSEGAAGSMFESISQLACTIGPRIIAGKGGGGAECTFDAGAR